MQTINKVTLLGALGVAPKTYPAANGTSVCTLSVATSTGYKDKANEWHNETEWHKVTLFGKLAEQGQEKLQKGSKVYVEGRLKTNKWNKDGIDRYSTEIIASLLIPLTAQPNQEQPRQQEVSNRNYYEEDVPF